MNEQPRIEHKPGDVVTIRRPGEVDRRYLVTWVSGPDREPTLELLADPEDPPLRDPLEPTQ